MYIKKVYLPIMFLIINIQLYAQQDTSWHSELPEVVVKERRSYINEVTISMNRKEFKTMPASFQDPMRILNRNPGFALVNDGSNALVYRGLPPEAIEWQYEGVRTVNPNHLANAGTINDVPTYNSGGTLGIPAVAIGNFSFDGSPATISNANVWGGAANITMSSVSKTYFELGLLGFEGGVNFKKKDKNHYLTARSSFVGLLGAMGVDFGGEKINFSDFAFRAEIIKSSNHNLYFFGNGGFSSNHKDHLPKTENKEISFKTIDDIYYNSYFGIGGLSYHFNKDNQSFTSSFAASFRDDIYERTRALDYSTFGFNIDKNYRLSENIPISNLTKYSLKKGRNQYSAGIRMMVQELYLDFNGIRSNQSRFSANPFINYNFEKTESYKYIGLNTGVSYSFLRQKINLYTSFEYRPIEKLIFKAKTTLTHPDNVGYFDARNDFKVISTEVSVGTKISDFKFIVRPFINFYENINVYFDNQRIDTIYSINSFSNQDILSNGVLSFDQELAPNGSNANSKGIEFSIDHQFKIGRSLFNTFANSTFFDMKYFDLNQAEYNTRFNYRRIFNLGVNYSLSFNKSKKMFITGISFHNRRGERLKDFQFFNPSDPTLPTFIQSDPYEVRFPNFKSIDLRIAYYYPSRSGQASNRWSLDIQNVFNFQTETSFYYDILQMSKINYYQLGLIPVLSYRYEF